MAADYISMIISNLGVITFIGFVERVKNLLPIEWFKYFLNDIMV